MICLPVLRVPILEDLAEVERHPVEQLEGALPPLSLWTKKLKASLNGAQASS